MLSCAGLYLRQITNLPHNYAFKVCTRDVIRLYSSGRDIERLAAGEKIRRWEPFRQQAEKRLRILDAATSLGDLAALHSNRLESLKGDRMGQYSIRINDQWRICFEWRGDEPDPTDVEIVDYP